MYFNPITPNNDPANPFFHPLNQKLNEEKKFKARIAFMGEPKDNARDMRAAARMGMYDTATERNVPSKRKSTVFDITFKSERQFSQFMGAYDVEFLDRLDESRDDFDDFDVKAAQDDRMHTAKKFIDALKKAGIKHEYVRSSGTMRVVKKDLGKAQGIGKKLKADKVGIRMDVLKEDVQLDEKKKPISTRLGDAFDSGELEDRIKSMSGPARKSFMNLANSLTDFYHSMGDIHQVDGRQLEDKINASPPRVRKMFAKLLDEEVTRLKVPHRVQKKKQTRKAKPIKDDVQIDEKKLTPLTMAFSLGRKAHMSGKRREPFKDNRLKSLLKTVDSTERNAMNKEWLKGWDEENLKEDVQLDEVTGETTVMAKGDRNQYERISRALTAAKKAGKIAGYEGAHYNYKTKMLTLIFDSKAHKPASERRKVAKMIKDFGLEFSHSVQEGFASDAQRRAAFASGYKAKGKKKKKVDEEGMFGSPFGRFGEITGLNYVPDVIVNRLSVDPLEILRARREAGKYAAPGTGGEFKLTGYDPFPAPNRGEDPQGGGGYAGIGEPEEEYIPIPPGNFPDNFNPQPLRRPGPQPGFFRGVVDPYLHKHIHDLVYQPDLISLIRRRPKGDERPAPGTQGEFNLTGEPLEVIPEVVPFIPAHGNHHDYAGVGIPEDEVEEGLRQAMSGPKETPAQKRKRQEKDNFDLYKKRQKRIAALRGDKSSRQLTPKQQRDYLRRVNLDQIRAMEETIMEGAKFSTAQLNMLKKEYGKINKIDPSKPTYKKLTDMLDRMSDEQLMQIHKANIKFMSSLAANRLQSRGKLKESIAEEKGTYSSMGRRGINKPLMAYISELDKHLKKMGMKYSDKRVNPDDVMKAYNANMSPKDAAKMIKQKGS